LFTFLGCTDIPNYIGIIGTPVIDPSTDIAYFFAKTYIPNYRVPGDTGVSNGVYYFYAVDVNTLEDVYPPILIDGTFADNAPEKYFVGGVVLQRPSLTQVGSVVYGAFGGHCDLFNYTGLVIGIDIVQAKIVTQWSVESGPLVPQTNNLLEDNAGGQGGIWMSGMSLASDGERIFVVSGNGGGHENNGAAAAGSSGCQTLGEAAINLAIDSDTGMLSPSDYFQPYDYENMDAADQDFGSGGIVLLDPATFSGGGIEKMAVTAGKNGKIYILDADDLGGYKLGPDETDGVLQTITTDEAVFGASGSYPLEGGFIYLTPVGYPTYVYSLGFTSEGLPQFSRIAQSNEVSAGRVGVGIPTVTSLNGQPGTAILWLTDPDAGIRAWYAVPQNGELRTIPMPQIGGANKFQRPAFGDGRVYTTDSNGILYCLGSPVNLPLNCTSPVDFGDVALGTTKTKEITCTAIVAIDLVVGLTVGDEFFQASNASLPTGPLKAGMFQNSSEHFCKLRKFTIHKLISAIVLLFPWAMLTRGF
jgi:iron transport multicopper oxidase